MNNPRKVTCPDCGGERIIRYYSPTDRCPACESTRRSAALTEQYFADRTRRDDGGCWVWHGALSHDGYGLLKARGYPRAAHRAAYTYFIGQIPPGAHVHHLCGVKTCVNPHHLVLVRPNEHPVVHAHSRARSGERYTRRPRRQTA